MTLNINVLTIVKSKLFLSFEYILQIYLLHNYPTGRLEMHVINTEVEKPLLKSLQCILLSKAFSISLRHVVNDGFFLYKVKNSE